ncbi:TlpA family protein disulfide reductase [Kitasatospora indigofera]|uniref:TlpA family protein disulfide reductase n=1 Tax=Kitasatospora indigofera TaxID=67307 RepID=UPI003696EF2A
MFTNRCLRAGSTGRTSLAFVVAALLAGCSSPGPAGAAASASPGAGRRPPVMKPVAERVPAPDLSGPTVDGGTVAWPDYRGKVVIVNTWGSWCDPCREEARDLQRAYAEYQGRGVEFLGINTREQGRDGGRNFEKEFGVKYPSLHDPDGSLVLKFPKGTITPQAVPNTLVVDRSGRLAGWALHQVGPADLEALIAPLLAEGP